MPVAEGLVQPGRQGQRLAGVLLGRLPGGVEPVPADADGAVSVGELDGVQAGVAAPHHGLPDPDPGDDQVDGLAHAYSVGGRCLFHAFSVSGVADRSK